MVDTIVNTSQWLADQHNVQVQAVHAGNSSFSAQCLPEVIPCGWKVFIAIGWAIVIYLASYFSYEKKVPFKLFGKDRDLGWVFRKLIVGYPFIALIVIGILTLGVKPL